VGGTRYVFLVNSSEGVLHLIILGPLVIRVNQFYDLVDNSNLSEIFGKVQVKEASIDLMIFSDLGLEHFDEDHQEIFSKGGLLFLSHDLFDKWLDSDEALVYLEPAPCDSYDALVLAELLLVSILARHFLINHIFELLGLFLGVVQGKFKLVKLHQFLFFFRL